MLMKISYKAAGDEKVTPYVSLHPMRQYNLSPGKKERGQPRNTRRRCSKIQLHR
ncbi:hypothetical protein DPMN_133381 [Dreissena polymorpha]|uniref:Uncharacterized protein n=1 Tax=Dreissena polymorpha TaxID=45954 RepID=A0A9D4JCV6_DREPO|nr:hypothetical protein DPMN_133381 [Dreissena polymorpha]